VFLPPVTTLPDIALNAKAKSRTAPARQQPAIQKSSVIPKGENYAQEKIPRRQKKGFQQRIFCIYEGIVPL